MLRAAPWFTLATFDIGSGVGIHDVCLRNHAVDIRQSGAGLTPSLPLMTLLCWMCSTDIGSAITLFVDSGPFRLTRVMDRLRELTDGHGSEHIPFKYMPDFNTWHDFRLADGHMLTEPWQRVGAPPLNIPQELGYPKKGE